MLSNDLFQRIYCYGFSLTYFMKLQNYNLTNTVKKIF